MRHILRLGAVLLGCALGSAPALADGPMKRGEPARLIKKSDPTIVKVRGAGVWGGPALAIDRNGRVKMFEVNRVTRVVTRVADDVGALALDAARQHFVAQAIGAKVAVGDAVGKKSKISRTGTRVRIGFSYPKGDARKNFNALVAVANVGGLIFEVKADPADGVGAK